MTIVRAFSIVAVIIVAGIVASALYVFYDVSMHAGDKGAPAGPITATLHLKHKSWRWAMHEAFWTGLFDVRWEDAPL